MGVAACTECTLMHLHAYGMRAWRVPTCIRVFYFLVNVSLQVMLRLANPFRAFAPAWCHNGSKGAVQRVPLQFCLNALMPFLSQARRCS